MQHQLFALSDGVLGAAYAVAVIVVVTSVMYRLSKTELNAIPTVGESGWLALWWTGRSFRNAHETVQEGYTKYKSAPFKIADRYRWIVVVGGRQQIEELRKAPDDVLSFSDAINDMMKLDYTVGQKLSRNEYHWDVIRSRLTRSLTGLHPEIQDEISVAFNEILDLKGNEWKSVTALSTIQKVVCRASNRLFVGLPLCRNPEWIDLILGHTLDIVNTVGMLRLFPSFLSPILARFVTNPQRTIERAMKYLAPIIEKRLKLLKEHGNDWAGKPNDLVSWLLEEAPKGSERTVRLWTLRILTTNFAAIHASSNSFSHALFFLAENPQYVQPLREEVEAIVEKEGWSAASVGKMHKIDSFMKESQRLVGVSSLNLFRLALKDFTFSDGTFITKGTMLAAPTMSVHRDDGHYDHAHEFNPFRFSDMREREGEETKHHFVSTSPEFLSFGLGKHACPGRFFAANELKAMLAFIVVTYEVKLEDNQTRPEGSRDGPAIRANPFAKVMFRRRMH